MPQPLTGVPRNFKYFQNEYNNRIILSSTLLLQPKDILGFNAIEHMEMTGIKGGNVQISIPILRVEDDKRRKLNLGTLKLWGIRFKRDTNFGARNWSQIWMRPISQMIQV